MSVSAGTQACWTAVGETGSQDDIKDAVGHFPTREEAEKDMRQQDEYSGQAVGVAQLSHPCFEAITVCGAQLDEEGDGPIHFDTAEAAVEGLLHFGCFLMPEGEWACPPDYACDCPLRDADDSPAEV